MHTLASLTQKLSHFHQQETHYINQENKLTKNKAWQDHLSKHSKDPQFSYFLLTLEALVRLRSSLYLQYKHLITSIEATHAHNRELISHRSIESPVTASTEYAQRPEKKEDTPPPINTMDNLSDDLQAKEEAYNAIMNLTPHPSPSHASSHAHAPSSISSNTPPLPSLSPHELTPPSISPVGHDSKSIQNNAILDFVHTPHYEVNVPSPPPFQTSPTPASSEKDPAVSPAENRMINQLFTPADQAPVPTDPYADGSSVLPWQNTADQSIQSHQKMSRSHAAMQAQAMQSHDEPPMDYADNTGAFNQHFPQSVGQAGTAIFSVDESNSSPFVRSSNSRDHLQIDESMPPPPPPPVVDEPSQISQDPAERLLSQKILDIGQALQSNSRSKVKEAKEAKNESLASEQSRAERIPMFLEIQVKTPYTHFQAQSHNINQGGLFLETAEMLKMGEEVQLSFQLPHNEHQIECLGLVRWSRDIRNSHTNKPAGLGVSFLNLRKSDWLQVAEYLNQRVD